MKNIHKYKQEIISVRFFLQYTISSKKYKLIGKTLTFVISLDGIEKFCNFKMIISRVNS